MKILYATSRYSPLRPDDGSGSDYRLYHALLDQGLDMQFVGPFEDKASVAEKIYRKFHGLFSKRRPAKYSDAMLRHSAQTLGAAAERMHPDLILTKNLAPVVKYRSPYPLVYMLDSTVAAFNRGWPTFSCFENWRMIQWEKQVLKQADAVITRSDWSRDSLVNDYGYAREKVHVVFNCASLPVSVIPRELEPVQPDFSTVRLLFVGKVAQLKGIDTAIEVINLLNQQGMPADLRVVGTSGEEQPHVHFMGLFHKSIESELQAYAEQYRWPHFLIHPARYDASPIVTAEAAAFGVPTLTNAVGGIASTVKDGISGIVLPAGSPAQDYVRVIRHYMDNPDEYKVLRETTRLRYEQELNWEAAGAKIADILHRVAATTSRRLE